MSSKDAHTTTTSNIALHIHHLLNQLQQHQPPQLTGQPTTDNSLYSGSLGLSFALLHCARAVQRMSPAPESFALWKCDLLHTSEQYLMASARSTAPPRYPNSISVLHGAEVGRAVTTALLHSEILQTPLLQRDPTILRASIQSSIGVVLDQTDRIFNNSDCNHGLLHGTSGWLWGLLFLRRTVPAARKRIHIELIQKVALHLIQEGQSYATAATATATAEEREGILCDRIARLPLMYTHRGVKLLGAGNGLIGIVYVLLLVVEELQSVSDIAFVGLIRQICVPVSLTIDYLLECRTTEGHLKHRPEVDSQHSVGFNGDSGLGLLLCKCAQVLGEPFQPLAVSIQRQKDG